MAVRSTTAELTRFDPFRQLAELDATMNRIFESTLLPRLPLSTSMWTPAVDVEETDTAYVVEADLPGVKESDVDIELTNNVLSIHGELK
ncbi:MAG TPA: Hsp20/alpha crystallin family protein, partial [Phototrophicaceae bacterium]|nr:Hsp20/alpha crystallin family protein [Phototrophicaceae bacterium]